MEVGDLFFFPFLNNEELFTNACFVCQTTGVKNQHDL